MNLKKAIRSKSKKIIRKVVTSRAFPNMLYKLARSPIGKLVFGKRATKQWDSLYSLYVYREPIEPT